MGILGKRRQDDESAQPVSTSGQRLWMENCTRCGCPLTILAVARPTEPLCTPCRAAVEAEAAAESAETKEAP
jgi:hypothetical protein